MKSELNNDWESETLIKNRKNLRQHAAFKKVKSNLNKKAKEEKTLIESKLNNDWEIKTLTKTQSRLVSSRDSKKIKKNKEKKKK